MSLELTTARLLWLSCAVLEPRLVLGVDVSRGSQCLETSKDAHVSREPLALVVQLPEFAQLDLAQRRPAVEEERHTLITILPRISKLVAVEQ